MRFAPHFLALALAVSPAARCLASGQTDKLGLDEAIRLALQKNGLVVAARQDTLAARARVAEANASFFPTLSPIYNYADSRNEGFGAIVNGTNVIVSHDTTFDLSLNWLMLDSGQRLTALRSSEAGARSTSFGEWQQRRSIIFEATANYYDTLRGLELQRVTQAEVDRAKTILDITVARIEAGALADKEKLQVEADLANAKVSEIQARLTAQVNAAALAATIGWPAGQALPQLAPPPAPQPPSSLPPEAEFETRGVGQRPDLKSAQEDIRALGYSLRQAEYNTRITYSLQGSLLRRLETDRGFERQLTFVASIPLFDAGASREVVRETRATRLAAVARFDQQVRQVRTDVKSAYLTYSLRGESLTAATAAQKAAQLNYDAAVESRKVGASTLADVINAQVALVTAETNYVQAEYDWYIAQAELAFTTGDPLPGEKP